MYVGRKVEFLASAPGSISDLPHNFSRTLKLCIDLLPLFIIEGWVEQGVVSPFCSLENIQKWQGPTPSQCVLPLQQFLISQGKGKHLYFHYVVSLKAFSCGPQRYKQTRICYHEPVLVFSIMGHFHNGL